MKKVWALITALALMLALAVGASAAVPKKPSEFAYAYDYDGSVLSSSTLDTIAQYGAALEDATAVSASSTPYSSGRRRPSIITRTGSPGGRWPKGWS